ncbi:MAG TPA: outer membrane lipoprotein-sorting protein [Chthoniobacteraceae bacterium]|nr:outer membrane lipoprotein-sorting protein [Chthoniobacteraceae bacterium]
MRHLRLVQPRLLILLTLLSASLAPAQEQVDAREVLKTVRVAQSAQNHVLNGQLRSGSKKIPFQLSMKDGTAKWQFSNPAQTILLRLGENTSTLEEMTPDGSQKVSGSKLNDSVRDTDITYEDLALRFLYWKDAKVEGDQTIMMTKSWQILAQPPSPASSSYSKVRLWVGKENGALLKAEAFGRDGKVARIFRVVSGQKLDDGLWILKSMRIESMGSARGGDRNPTYLEISGVAK